MVKANWAAGETYTHGDQNALATEHNATVTTVASHTSTLASHTSTLATHTADIAAGPDPDSVGLTELSATGTPSSANFLRGDNTWAAPAAATEGRAVALSIALG